MSTIHLTRQILSEHLELPELKPFIGKEVAITITETAAEQAHDKWKALTELAGQNVVNSDVVSSYRVFEASNRDARRT